MSFPNAYSRIYHNELGEVLGWENPAYDEPEYCDQCGGHHNSDECPILDEDEPDDEEEIVDDYYEEELDDK
jgi:hypothetical protein